MSQKVVVGVVFVAAMFMSIMDATIVNVALPTIGRDFGVSATAVDSISIAYLVSLAVFIPASGGSGGTQHAPFGLKIKVDGTERGVTGPQNGPAASGPAAGR